MIPLTDIRSDILPELENRYGEVRSRIESDGKRLFLKFSTEENALCGHAAVSEYVNLRELPIRVISSTEPRSIILISGREDEIL